MSSRWQTEEQTNFTDPPKPSGPLVHALRSSLFKFSLLQLFSVSPWAARWRSFSKSSTSRISAVQHESARLLSSINRWMKVVRGSLGSIPSLYRSQRRFLSTCRRTRSDDWTWGLLNASGTIPSERQMVRIGTEGKEMNIIPGIRLRVTRVRRGRVKGVRWDRLSTRGWTAS